MSNVALSFSPAPENVRTARLVAVAVGRRAGLDEDRLDDLRLSVGEACARAVRRCRETATAGVVLVEIDDRGPSVIVTVTGHADAGEADDESVALAVIRELSDDMAILDGPGGHGGVLRVSWKRSDFSHLG